MAGDPTFLALLEQMKDLHVRKSAGYAGADNPDPWANFRRSEEFGVAAELGVLIRLSDKISRIAALTRDPSNDQVNEPIEDTAFDAASYSLIYICLRRERLAREAAVLEYGGFHDDCPIDTPHRHSSPDERFVEV